jgi:peptidoglycan/LPS O-acetylase OafA/YrhL
MNFRQDIEGLRAVAVLAVVLFHADVPGVGGGYVGVDVFFVISGFLITGLLWREVGSLGTVRLRRFYGARALRLLPASATVGVATAIASAALLPPMQARSVLVDGIASALYVGNYRFAIRHVDYLSADIPPSPFQHYWSLGVEEQFYLVWPAVIIAATCLVRRAGSGARATSSARPYLLVLALGGAVSFTVSLMATHQWPSWAFFSLPTRAWELAAGGAVALTPSLWRRLPALPAAIVGWAGLALVLLTCSQFSTKTFFPGTAALLPVLGTALAIGAGCAAPSPGCTRFLSLPPMRAIGRASYSWYLWHWPVLVLAPPLLGHPLTLTGRLAAAAVSGGLAVLTLHFLENPVRFAASVRRSPAGSLALGGAATAAAACASVALLVMVPIPVGRGVPAVALTVTVAPAGRAVGSYNATVQHGFAQVHTAVAASDLLKAVPSNLDPQIADTSADERDIYLNGCLRGFFEVGQPECASGDTTSTTTVALVGDSHAAMWNTALQQVAEQRHWRLETLAKVNCPLQELPVTSSYLGRRYTECEQWRGEIMARLKSEHPRLVVLDVRRYHGADYGFTAYDHAYDRAWIDSLGRAVGQLTNTGASVLVLGPIPDPGTDVPTCLSMHLDNAQACAPPRSVAVNDAGVATEQAATTAGGGHYAELTELFCGAERCPFIVGNDMVYFDDNHVTNAYAQVLSPIIGLLADRALADG